MNRDPYNCNTYIVRWKFYGKDNAKSFTTRHAARKHKSKLKNRLGKRWHEYIEITQIVTTSGFILEENRVW